MNAIPAIETVDLTMRFPQQQGWRSLFKREPGKVALDNVNLAVNTGEIFGLLGPNGAGKTTLVKILSTLSIPTQGQAMVTGLDVVRHSLEVRSRIGVVYGDERTFFWRLSALDNLLFYASLYHIPPRQARKRAWELLEMVGLEESANIRMHHYSSGMKQRASIARGLLNDPDILIMDEPTRSLDPIAALELRRLVKERVVSSSRTVLIATNIMSEAEYLCDRVAFISHGRIQMIGEIDHLRRILQSEEAHIMLASDLPLPRFEMLREMEGVRALVVTPLADGMYQIEATVESELGVVPELIRTIVESGGRVWSCTPKDLTLEEMFSIVVEVARREQQLERIA